MSNPSAWEIPDDPSEAGQWNHLEFDFKVDNYPITWDTVDSRDLIVRLTRTIGIALLHDLDAYNEDSEPARVHVKAVTVKKTDFVTDEELNAFLDGLSE